MVFMQRAAARLCLLPQSVVIGTGIIFYTAKAAGRRLAATKNFFALCLLALLMLFNTLSQAQQNVDFTMSVKEECVPHYVNFTDISTGGERVVSRTWNLGNGIIPNTSQSVGANYNVANTYTITLTVTFANGVKDSAKKTLIIHPLPVANFFTADTIGCAPLTVHFTDLSTTATGTVTDWFWDLDVNTSNAKDPVQAYTQTGNYRITLYVLNSWGCKSDTPAVKPDYIRVVPRPNVSFSLTPQNTCKDSLTVFFQNNSSHASDYSWTFGDGNTSTAVNPVHFYNGAGTYTVKLSTTVAPNCSDSRTTTVNLGTPKATILSAPDTVCEKTTYRFNGMASPGASCTWLFRDRNATIGGCTVDYGFNNPGLYDVLFIVRNGWGCADTATTSVFVKASPKPDFVVDTTRSCKAPFTVQALNLTQDRSLKFTWNFGDNSPPVTAVDPPPHTYTGYNGYTITVTAEDAVTGCKTTVQKAAIVQVVRPSVSLGRSPASACAPPKAFTFTAFPNFSIEPAVKYIWTYGDGSPADTTTTATVTHTYTAGGTFTVNVSAYSKNDCSASAQTSVALADTCPVIPPPVPPKPVIFVSGPSCNACNRVSFRDTVSNATVLNWNFGDGTVVNTAADTITHWFPFTADTFTVSVTRRNNLTGETTSTQTIITILCTADPAFTVSRPIACIGDLVHFTPLVADSSLQSAYNWNFGDGNGTTVYNPPNVKGDVSHSYSQLGTYVIRLVVFDKKGCSKTAQTDTVLIQGPKPDFTAQPRSTCDTAFTVYFKDSTALNAGVPIVKWNWNFGNGTYQTVKDTLVPVRYRSNTTPVLSYNVSLSVTDSTGCTNSITKNNYIKLYRPRANFSSRDTLQCNRFSVAFGNSSQAVNGTYTWHFGDGQDSIANSPSHLYPSGDGDYTVTLVVHDENGCVDSITKTRFVKFVHPQAQMSIKDTSKCWPWQFGFCDSSRYAYSYLWNFSDGITPQTTACLKRSFPSPGNYTATLVVTGPNGCRDTITQPLRIKGAKGDFWEGPLWGCKPFKTNMKVINRSNIDYFAWDWNDGSVVTPKKEDSVISHTYPEAGKYLPNVIILSSEGCPYSLIAKDSVIVDSAKALFSATPLFSCSNDSVRVTDLSKVPDFSTITKYTWLWGDGKTSSLARPLPHAYDAGGVYSIQLAIESKYGCKDTFRLPDAVKIFSPPQLRITGKDSACQRSTLSFTGAVQSLDSVKTVQWLLNGNAVGSDTAVALRFDAPGTFPLSLNVTTRNGCNASLTKPVTVFPAPVPKAAPDTVVCVNSSLVLKAFDGTNYQWSPAATLNHPDSAFTLAKPALGLTPYVVTVTNAFGCAAKDTVTVKADDSVHLRTTSPAEVCLGESIVLSATATTNKFLWSPANWLNSAAVANPVARPADTTVYTVVGFTNNTCPNDTGFVQVNVNPLPQVTAKANPLQTTPGSEVKLVATGSADVVRYSWMPAAGLLNPSSAVTYWQSPDTSTTFRVTVQNRSGCPATDVVRVEVKCAASSVVVPSAFTPKGRNPYFRPAGLYKSDPHINYFRVYNRWGQLLYNVENQRVSQIQGWDGRISENIQGSAVFVWILEVECAEGPVQKKGTVALIR